MTPDDLIDALTALKPKARPVAGIVCNVPAYRKLTKEIQTHGPEEIFKTDFRFAGVTLHEKADQKENFIVFYDLKLLHAYLEGTASPMDALLSKEGCDCGEAHGEKIKNQ